MVRREEPMWTSRTLAHGAILASAVLAAGPASAQFEAIFGPLFGTSKGSASPQWQLCEGQNRATIEQRITNCTMAIAGEQDKLNLAGAYANRARAYQDRGDADHAIEDFDQAIRNDPKLAEAYFGRGGAHTGKRAYDLAIQDYTQAIGLQPTNPDAYFNRGIY
jgi:tetratricopeptide (TPR) repeat protein